MQTLGLSSETKRSDGWLKSLFWPTVENAWDVDYLGQQGMWICTAVAVFSFAASLLTANPILILTGLVTAVFFLLGGMGIREGNWPAAAVLLAVQVCNVMIGPNVFSIAFTAILLSNLRATFLASEWRPPQQGEDRPTRFHETLADKYVDQLPPLLWPKLQIPFFIVGIGIFLVSLLGVLYMLALRFGLVPHK